MISRIIAEYSVNDLGCELVEGSMVKSLSPDVGIVILCRHLDYNARLVVNLFCEPVLGKRQVCPCTTSWRT